MLCYYNMSKLMHIFISFILRISFSSMYGNIFDIGNWEFSTPLIWENPGVITCLQLTDTEDCPFVKLN